MTIELSGVTQFIMYALALALTFFIGYIQGRKVKKVKQDSIAIICMDLIRLDYLEAEQNKTKCLSCGGQLMDYPIDFKVKCDTCGKTMTYQEYHRTLKTTSCSKDVKRKKAGHKECHDKVHPQETDQSYFTSCTVYWR